MPTPSLTANTLAGRIAKALNSQPPREWTLSDLAEATILVRPIRPAARDRLAVVAKEVAREIGWTGRLRIEGRRRFTVYMPPKEIP
jgi:hypothetical protein